MTAAGDLRSRLSRHVTVDGTFATPFDGVQLFRVSAPVERLPGVYSPSVCVIVQGTKHAYFDGRAHRYDSSHYLCATMPLPVEAEIRDASPEHPVLGLLISFESRTVTELMVRLRAVLPQPATAAVPDHGLLVAPWGDDFTATLERMLDLLDDEVALDLLGPGRLQELLYAILVGPAGPTIRRTLGGAAQHLGGVLTYIRNHLDEPLAVDDLAQRAGMSRAAFDRHFKATTSMSPLQYLKALRLNDAALLIVNGTDITRAAAAVGYTSPSQFSREFKRHVGSTPRAWANAHRGAADPQAVALTA